VAAKLTGRLEKIVFYTIRAQPTAPRLDGSLLALTPPGTGGTKLQFWGGYLLIVHKSAIKRHRQSLKRRSRNVETKSKLRTLMKRVRQAIDAKNHQSARNQITAVNKALGKAVSKGIIKRNTASRWLSRLSRSAARLSSGVQS
jgi:small subunit ribosomal protein S20